MYEKKYKVLIADDEYWTREKLRNMILWEKYGLEFLEPAVNGEDALQSIEEYRPDILITDINMPFLDGVQLLTEVGKKYPDIVTFVISGYDDFDYVRDTFMSGAINYLVKPVTKIELIKAVVKALEKISERENEQLELLKAASVIQDSEFSQMIQRREVPENSFRSTDNFMEFAEMSLMLIKIHNLQEAIRASGHDRNLISYNIKKEIKAAFNNENLIVFNNIYRLNEFIVVTDKSKRDLIKTAEKIRFRFSTFIKSCITICISAQSYSMESIHMAYVEAIGILMTRKYCLKDEVLISDRTGGEKEKVVAHFKPDYEKHLKNALRTGDVELIKKIVFKWTGLIKCQKNGWSYLEAKQTVRQVLTILLDYVIQKQGFMKVADVESFLETIEKTTESLDLQLLCEMLEEVIEYLIPEKEEHTTNAMAEIVHQAAGWIDEHYSEEMSLAMLAERYHVASTYFSRMFRQEIGESLILYITRRRVEKAKEYIRNSDMNLTEIAFVVGYDDYAYFSRVFKKSTGVSPRDYKSQCREEKM